MYALPHVIRPSDNTDNMKHKTHLDLQNCTILLTLNPKQFYYIKSPGKTSKG
jgi:hypothetical protein